jgi:glutamyl-tRNA(Gln) amidotransferase subunit E
MTVDRCQNGNSDVLSAHRLIEDVGLRAGLEIHQQLDTDEKLFCSCPTKLRDVKESNYSFYRYLRPTKSEIGETDLAALEEAKRNRRYVYKAYDTTCLVENDEEPPHEVNQEALDISLEVARLFDMDPVDEVQTMRKIVIDGSNTAGFQRTALIAMNGRIKLDDKVFRIETLCLEEEAARKISEGEKEVTYSLDRLGIPLVEISTAADIKTPEEGKRVAGYIGMILRSTGKVKRGLGTIRQDVNISIEKGARVEIKGVQNLELIDTIIENEILRQVNLLNICEMLKSISIDIGEIIDVKDVFKETKCKIIENELKRDGVILALCLRGFGGLLGEEIQTKRRLGSEFSDRAKRYVNGIFHTDELPAYGISEEEKNALKEIFQAKEEDCVVIVAGKEKDASEALKAVKKRAKECVSGIPEEVRRVLPDGSSEYMRPLPGAARMYPETDIPPIEIDSERINKIELPELFSHRKERYMEEYGLNEELAHGISSSPNFDLFERIMELGVPASLVVRTLGATMSELAKDGYAIEKISDEHLIEIFKKISEGKIAKEAVPDILGRIADRRTETLSVDVIISKLGLGSLEDEEIEEILEDIVRSKKDLIDERGIHSLKPLMGLAMERLRGRVDGKRVSEILKRKVSEMVSTIHDT